MPATWLWMKGSEAMLRSCCMAWGSKAPWLSHSFSGAPPVS
jgi:hypothetical protein